MGFAILGRTVKVVYICFSSLTFCCWLVCLTLMPQHRKALNVSPNKQYFTTSAQQA